MVVRSFGFILIAIGNSRRGQQGRHNIGDADTNSAMPTNEGFNIFDSTFICTFIIIISIL